MPILSSFAGLSAKALGFFYNLRLTWSQKTINDYTSSAAVAVRKAIYAPFSTNKYFLFGGNQYDLDTDNYFYSADGLTWTKGDMPYSTGFPDPWSNAAYNGSTLVAVTSAHIDYTTNGSDWTIVETCADGEETGYLTTVFQLNPDDSIIWDGTRFLLGGVQGTGDIDPDTDEPESVTYATYYSTDGQSWTGINDIGFLSRFLGYSASSGRYFAYLGRPGTGNTAYYTCTSNPLVSGNWTKLTMPSGDYTNFEYGNGVYLAGDDSGTGYATSPDGTTWTARTLPVAQTGKITFIAGKFRFFAADKIYASLNGIDWEVEKTFSSSTLDNVNSWINAANVVLAFGQRDDGTSTKYTSTYIYGV